MSEWRETSLGEVIELKRGYDLPVAQRRAGSVPIVSSSGRSGFHDEAKVKGPGVVTGRSGTLGNVYYIEEDFWPLNTSLYVRDFKGNDRRFVSYWLLTVPLATLDGGAANPTLNRNHAHLLRVRVPSPRLQIRIADVLGAIDDLIENNRRRIALLERMAQAIYREWFVHFRYPGHEDDELVDSPLGSIPARWGVRPLFAEAEVSFGFALKSKGFGAAGEWPVIRIRDVPNGSTPTFTDEFPGDRYIVDNGDTLIGMDGDFHMCRWSGGRALLNQRVTKVRPNGTLGAEALYWALRGPIREWNERIVGTTVAHLGKRHLEEVALAIPPAETVDVLNDSLEPLGDLAIELRRSSRALSSLRDRLLPRLVAGAIDVSELDLDALLDETAA